MTVVNSLIFMNLQEELTKSYNKKTYAVFPGFLASFIHTVDLGILYNHPRLLL